MSKALDAPPAVMEIISGLQRGQHGLPPKMGFMTHLKKTQSGKAAEVLISITAGDHFWVKSAHKSIILAIVLPFSMVGITLAS